MNSAREITITLDKLSCQSEVQVSGSNPYIWPAMVFINKRTLQVGLVSIPETSAHRILKAGMRPGDIVDIEPQIGALHRFFQEPVEEIVLLLTVALFEDNETPDDAVRAGFRAFRSTLRSSIESRLFALGSQNPEDVEAAREEIAQEVEDAVTAATSGALSTAEKIKVGLGILTPDASMGSGSASFEEIVPRPFSLVIGEPMGGRLLRYVDASQTGGGDVSAPQVIGRGGWQQFLHLFPGDDNVIYAVDTAGRLLRYVDASQSGGGDVSAPQVIGQGGWQQFRFLFAGTGRVIYAVDQAGRLLRYVDASQTGGGDVSAPQVIGQGGWQQFRFLFPGAGNVIYAVDQAGRLLRYVDASQTGGGDVSAPQVIGQGGWQQFGFLFSGPGNVIYAAERALTSKHHYEIAGRLGVRVQRCFDEMIARNQARVALDAAKKQLAELRTRLAQAGSRAERDAIKLDIAEASEQVIALEAQLAAAESAFQTCLASSGGVLGGGGVIEADPVR